MVLLELCLLFFRLNIKKFKLKIEDFSGLSRFHFPVYFVSLEDCLTEGKIFVLMAGFLLGVKSFHIA